MAPAVGVFFACCSRTPSPPFDCTSVRVLHDDTLVLGGGATGASSSSDHSNIAALCVRAVRPPPNEMPTGLRGATFTVLLFFWAGSSFVARFP